MIDNEPCSVYAGRCPVCEREGRYNKSLCTKLFYLFTWLTYESDGVLGDFVGSYTTLEEAMHNGNMSENAEILEVKPDGLWRAAARYGYREEWEMIGVKLV